MQQRLVQVVAEPVGLTDCRTRNSFERLLVDLLLQRFQVRLDGVRRLVDQQPVLVDEVRVVLAKLVVLQVVGFPFLLAVLVVAVDVLLQQGDGDLFPAAHPVEAGELHLGRRDEQPIPVRVAQQLQDALARQVQVVPRPLVLEVLQLEVDGVDVHEGQVLVLEHAGFHHGRVARCEHALALLRLNLGIPVEHDRVLQQEASSARRASASAPAA